MRTPQDVLVSRLGSLAASVVLIVTSVWAYYVIFSQFSWYDDEGYVMMTVRQFAEGRALYDDVYSQYGPFYYVLRLTLLLILRAPVSHDVTRLLTLVTWVAVAIMVAGFLWRTTRSGVVTLLGYLLTFQHLRPLANEPGHPQELCLLLVAFLIVLVSRWNTPRHVPALMVAAGVIVGGLILTKINVGTYALFGLATAFATFASRGRMLYLILISIAGSALPWAVMRTHVSWSSRYAAVVSVSFVAIVMVCRVLSTERPFGGAAVRRFAVAAVSISGATCVAVLARGTSPTGLLTGVLLQPLGFSEIFFNEVRLPVQAVVIAVASLILALGYLGVCVHRPDAPGAVNWMFWWLKAAVGVFGIGLAMVFPLVLLGFGPALLWLVLIRPLSEPWAYEDLFPRVVLVGVANFQAMQAYPVAGSQIAWATLLTLPAMLLCVSDAVQELATTRAGRPVRAAWANRRWLQAVALGAILLFFVVRLDVVGARERYQSSLPLSLPGSRLLRLPHQDVATFRWLVAQATQCTTVITLPGLNSLYFWSGLEPPTGFNATAWPALLDRSQQQRIVDTVRPRQNVCVVEYPAGIRTFGRDVIVFQQPLMRFVRDEFRVVQERSGYQVLRRVQPDRREP
jgi:hypothetical protein